jgi:hypothetical protein
MPRYWAIAPCYSEDPDLWDAVWNFDLEQGVISIGWAALGDVSALDVADIRSLYLAHYPDDKPKAAHGAARMLYKFYHVIRPGDFVVARWGLKHVAGVGEVVSTGYYDPNKLREVFRALGPDYEANTYPNHLDVKWDPELRDYGYESRVFGLQTLHELTTETFLWLTEGD